MVAELHGGRAAGDMTAGAAWPPRTGGIARTYLDERADASQRNALSRILRGEVGGPWGIFINTYELPDPEPARFDLDLADYDTRLTIGEAVHLELQTIRNPVTHVDVRPEMLLPEGLVTRHGRLAASKVFRVRSGIEYDHSGRYAAFGRFRYAP